MGSRAHEPEMSTATGGSAPAVRERAVTFTDMSAARSARVIWGALAIRRYSSGICDISSRWRARFTWPTSRA